MAQVAIIVMCFVMTLFDNSETSTSCGQQLSSKGTEFMIGILAPISAPGSIYMYLTTETAAEVRIIAPFINLDTHVTFRQKYLYMIANTLAQLTNGTEFKGIEITSNASISVLVQVGSGDKTEGFLALPTESISTTYIAASYHPYSSYFSEFLIVGVDKTSNITIELSYPYRKDTQYSANTNIQLQKFETYQFKGKYDVSGTIIKSDNPVSVFSGSAGSQIPLGQGDWQYLVEQMIPTNLWNFEYIIPSIYPRWGYVIKIFATEDNTEVNYRNSTHHFIAFLNEHLHIELLFGQEPTVVSANKPINVIEYGFDVDGSNGDPFMLTVQSVSQYQSVYTFTTEHIYNSPPTLVVTIKYADLSGLLLDGNHTIQSARQIPVAPPMQEYTTVFMNITYNTRHVLSHSTNKTFGASIYGLPVTTVGYGYPVELTFSDLNCQKPHTTSMSPGTTSQPSHGQGQQHVDYHSTGNGTHCFSCGEMSELQFCDGIRTCDVNEVCYVQSYVTNMFVKHYRSGCINKDKCNSGQHQQLGSECLQCCDGNFCNTQGCGDDGIASIQHRGPMCLDCQHISDPTHCQQMSICSADQVCRIEKYHWANNQVYYSMGCASTQCSNSKRSLSNTTERLNQRNIPFCINCCTTDFCNQNCTGHLDISIVG